MLTILKNLKGKGYKSRLMHPADEYWDRKLRVSTFGYVPRRGEVGSEHWQVHYEPTSYGDIFRVLKVAGLKQGDVFLDYGSGMGRVVFAASHLGARRAIGIEIVPELSQAAITNQKRSGPPKTGVEFVCMDAGAYVPDEVSLVYMFHPFGPGTLRQVLANLRAAKRPAGSQLRIIYLNPVYEEVLAEAPWLEKAAEIPQPRTLFGRERGYRASVWQSVDPAA